MLPLLLCYDFKASKAAIRRKRLKTITSHRDGRGYDNYDGQWLGR